MSDAYSDGWDEDSDEIIDEDDPELAQELEQAADTSASELEGVEGSGHTGDAYVAVVDGAGRPIELPSAVREALGSLLGRGFRGEVPLEYKALQSGTRNSYSAALVRGSAIPHLNSWLNPQHETYNQTIISTVAFSYLNDVTDGNFGLNLEFEMIRATLAKLHTARFICRLRFSFADPDYSLGFHFYDEGANRIPGSELMEDPVILGGRAYGHMLDELYLFLIQPYAERYKELCGDLGMEYSEALANHGLGWSGPEPVVELFGRFRIVTPEYVLAWFKNIIATTYCSKYPSDTNNSLQELDALARDTFGIGLDDVR